MGGKGQKRREKNYRSAHGGHVRLPPPPDPSYVDALPSKLRRLIAFSATAASPPAPTTRGDGGESGKGRGKGKSRDAEKGIEQQKRKQAVIHAEDKDRVGEVLSPGQKAEVNENLDDTSNRENGTNNDLQKSGDGKKKKKRKRDEVNDLRYESELAKLGVVSTRRQRKKEFLKYKKKKQKKANMDDMEFHKHDIVKFGEVVQAPPKLIVPKAFKNPLAASHERLRLKAVEAYRDRKKWTSRPGVDLRFALTPSTL